MRFFHPGSCRHGKMMDFQCLGSGAFHGVELGCRFISQWVGVASGDSLFQKNIYIYIVYSKGILPQEWPNNFLNFPGCWKHHQIYLQKTVRHFWAYSMSLCLNIGHVSRVCCLVQGEAKESRQGTGRFGCVPWIGGLLPPSNLWFFTDSTPR